MTDSDERPRVYRQLQFRRPPGAAELLLVRHGESAPADPEHPHPLVDGHGDPPLDPVGVEQAERVADRLAGEDISAIYVTTLQRTAQTAAPLAARLGLEPVVERDLREVHLGEWEGGQFRRRVSEGDPLALRMAEEQRWDVIPGAEPGDVFAARVTAAIRRIAERHRDQCVAVFAHGGTIGQVLASACGARGFTFTGSDNGSISHLVVWGERWTIRRYNDTAHLSARFTTAPEPLT
ncbi:MAG TPA: histidine phosphatase family protein [Acidimicrobiales bacterium]|nr:histidine phosphatase family protein [Acidimicrobiales bacterium]